MNKITLHYLLSLVLVVLVFISCFLLEMIPSVGYEILTYIYISILLGLFYYYFLTTYLKVGLTILSFTLNFILWVAEQVSLSSQFHDTFLYQNDNFRVTVVILGGLLWATNKLLLDKLFIKLKADASSSNRLDILLGRVKNKI
jgi:predicted neutral ceramidase superfamily lipid hydrolase